MSLNSKKTTPNQIASKQNIKFRSTIKTEISSLIDCLMSFGRKSKGDILKFVLDQIPRYYIFNHKIIIKTKQKAMESTITRSIYHLGGKATSLQIYSNIGNKSGDQKFINIHDHLDIMVADGRLRCELVPANNGDSSYRRVYSVTGPN